MALFKLLFSFTAGLRMIDADKLVSDTLLLASFDEVIIGCSFKSLAVIGIGRIDSITALGNDNFCEKAGDPILVLYGKISAYSSLEKSRWLQTGTHYAPPEQVINGRSRIYCTGFG